MATFRQGHHQVILSTWVKREVEYLANWMELFRLVGVSSSLSELAKSKLNLGFHWADPRLGLVTFPFDCIHVLLSSAYS